MQNIFVRYNYKEIMQVIIPVFVLTNFYNYRPLVESYAWKRIITFISLGIFFYSLNVALKKYSSDSISLCVKRLILLFVGSIFVGLVMHGHGFTGGLTHTANALLSVFFFYLMKQRISTRSVMQSIWILLIIGTIFHIGAICTYPNNIFCYSEQFQEGGEGSLDSRGVIRFAVPCNDFVVMGIFYALNRRKQSKWYYFLLLFLFVLLSLRGTRTPVFATIIISALYVGWNYKHKIRLFIIMLFGVAMMPSFYNHILESNSNNPIVKYIQLTDKQIDANENEEDIRIQMAKYYIFDYNTNIAQLIIGNGSPSLESKYGQDIEKNKETKSYYLSDVSYAMIFVYYGLLGLFVYYLLLKQTIKINVKPDFEYSKLFILYFFFTSITGSYLMTRFLYMSFGLYLMEQNRIKKQ